MLIRPIRTLQVEPVLPAILEPLRALVGNLRWTWDADTVALFRDLDPVGWERSGHNPVALLQELPAAHLERLAHDPGFVDHLNRCAQSLEDYLRRPPQVEVPGTSARSAISYFSLEFALTESLPVYSGGLGVLAGDHLKSASDLGLPLVGVGILYREGYFLQTLSPDGWQREDYQPIDLSTQPLRPVLDDAGQPLTVQVPIGDRDVGAAIWRLQVGRVPLFLLTTDIDGNSPADREISARLYGGDIDTRIQQEILLGIGGIRALHAMDLHPAVCHMNEGHSALLGVDRIRTLMAESGCSFAEARLPVTAATVFTTHTAVAAGIDLFPPDLVKRYLGRYYSAMGLDDRTFIGLGRTNPDDDHEPFSMALLGLRLSGYRNGVSKLHRTVSQRLWSSAWPDLPAVEVPISAITNGVHLATWVSEEVGELYDRYLGRQWREEPGSDSPWAAASTIPDEELWSARERQRGRLVVRARQQHREGAARRGGVAGQAPTGEVLDGRTLTIGFARRFAGYKRATLLFRDPARLARIVNHPLRPIQFIFAGKAHPRDEPAKQLIREVVAHSREPEFRDRLVILERYDVELARALVQGCDAWLNTPLRPLEASGTSGMKAVANGALHISVQDGWWAEAYQPGLGWAVGRDRVDDDPEVQDAFDAESLYDLLEHEVAPLFYDRDGDGLPREWLKRMKASIVALAPQFNTGRMVTDYARFAYTPAAEHWVRLRSGNGAVARDLAAWLRTATAAWPQVQVVSAEDNGSPVHLDGNVRVRAKVRLGGLSPADIHADVVFGRTGFDGGLQPAGEAALVCSSVDGDGVGIYEGEFQPIAGRSAYTIRLVPSHPELPDPFSAGLVRWA